LPEQTTIFESVLGRQGEHTCIIISLFDFSLDCSMRCCVHCYCLPCRPQDYKSAKRWINIHIKMHLATLASPVLLNASMKQWTLGKKKILSSRLFPRRIHFLSSFLFLSLSLSLFSSSCRGQRSECSLPFFCRIPPPQIF
jgi:hypothetical protein